MLATMDKHLAYLPQLEAWMRYHSIDWQGSFQRDVVDFRLGNVDDVPRRWIPRLSDDHSVCRVCLARQSTFCLLRI